MMKRKDLAKYAWLSIIAAIATIALKAAAYFLTDSIGLLSDALESVVNLVASVTTLTMLTIAALPPDEDHAFGHDKAEYFASGIEGLLIIVAAIGICWTAVLRILSPQPLEQIGIGVIISIVATLINLVVARVLIRAGKFYESIALEADGKHLFTDVWTSLGVIAGIVLVAVTNFQILDSIVALIVAVNITWTGFRLIQRSVFGLMDAALSPETQTKIIEVLDVYKKREVDYHALRTRRAGIRQFASVHILVPGEWTVQRGHQLLEEIEGDIRRAVPNIVVFTHLESLDDPASWQDIELDRLDDITLRK
ncbi:MAG: cation transporter [Pyrinomonadaceae bacterium]|nr:cation transporter [Pyrinomonadaceae bacterium]